MAEAKKKSTIVQGKQETKQNSKTFNIIFLCRTQYYTTPSDTQAERVLYYTSLWTIQQNILYLNCTCGKSSVKSLCFHLQR